VSSGYSGFEFYHVLIVDDDDRIRELLERYLVKNCFVVSTSQSAGSARLLMQKYIFDMMVVDYMMPGESGVDFLSDLRRKKDNTPAIMLTALGETENRIEGLAAGADDYLPKPFEPRELVLRINNILKRTNGIQKNNFVTTFDDFSFDLNKNELYRSGIPVKLTGAETKILKIFCSNLNVIVTRENIRSLCDEINERSVDVSITRLRKKIEKEPKNPRFLKTIRNKGYMFVIDR
jgi:two-component system phosphate regulon response regulator OmpR